MENKLKDKKGKIFMAIDFNNDIDIIKNMTAMFKWTMNIVENINKITNKYFSLISDIMN